MIAAPDNVPVMKQPAVSQDGNEYIITGKLAEEYV
jgi:hypothetical protein